MPRGPRSDAPGLLHHVWARGIERRKIFLSDEDRLDFLGRLGKACGEDGVLIYAWCLMDNHFHLQIRSGEKPLGVVMRRLLTGYAMGFNRRNARSGHLFQNRYKSTVVDDERYFLSLMRYIHLNPLRAGLVASVSALERYRWSGYSVLMGYRGLDWQDTDEVLSRFGKRVGPARRELSAFMGLKEAREEVAVFERLGVARNEKKEGKGRKTERGRGTGAPEGSRDGRIVGEGKFVRLVVEKARGDFGNRPLMRIEGAKQRGERFDRLVDAICDRFDVSKEELYGGNKRRAVSRARQVLSYVSTRCFGMSAAEVGRAIGVSGQGILKAAGQGRTVLGDMKLREEELTGE